MGTWDLAVQVVRRFDGALTGTEIDEKAIRAAAFDVGLGDRVEDILSVWWTFDVVAPALAASPGGTFVGRGGLRGVVLPGGSDWQRARTDGSLEIEAHYALRTDDGGIEVHSSGIRRASSDVLTRLAAGAAVHPDEYYFRTHIRLEAAGPGLAHLDGLLGVATGQREPHHVHIHVHEVL